MHATLRTLTVLLLLAPCSSAQSPEDVGTDVTYELVNGDTVSGVLRELGENSLLLETPYFGVVTLDRAAILPPEQAVAEVTTASPWSGSFDASFTGKSGNTIEQNQRLDLRARHEADTTIDSYLATYDKTGADHSTTGRRVFGEARREWILKTSKWRPFVQASMEKDRTKNWNERLSVAGGGAYPVIDGELERLTARFGLGSTREVGGDDGSWVPDAVLGAEYSLELALGRAFGADIEIRPDLKDTGEYRAVSRAEYRVVLHPGSPWSMKLGVEHNMDSQPDVGDAENDFTYYFGAGYVF